MLRVYQPIIADPIFTLQVQVQHLVCDVWCNASATPCDELLLADFKIIYDAYDWLKTAIDDIYTKCIVLTPEERTLIREAFIINNQIENLCNAAVAPKYLDGLPNIVETDMKPLLVDFYEVLLERARVPGTKKSYYESLITSNEFRFCPCCGMTDFELEDSEYREAFDHYLPKSIFPFSSINFENLVPLCYKCNSDRKGVKNPIENQRKTFYPFSSEEHKIEIKFTLDKSKDLDKLERQDLIIEIIGDTEKIETWDSLFDVKDRYNDMSRSFTKTHLIKIKRRHMRFLENNPDWTYQNSLDELINDYENDKFEDKKFLKIPLMKELKNYSSLIEVYS